MSKHLAIVLAAGKGTRMESDLPKVLVPACGRPLIAYVLDALQEAGIEDVVVVVGYQADLVREALAGWPGLRFVEQKQQLGTGHAVQVCREHLASHEGAVLVLTGDSPLTQATSLRQLLDRYEQSCPPPACVLGTLIKEDPTGMGRIVRDAAGNFVAIVEHKDATADQLQLHEVNMSTYVFDCQKLLPALDQLRNDNRQGELYITDCPGILQAAGEDVQALPVLRPCEALSINNLADLALVEEEMRKQER